MIPAYPAMTERAVTAATIAAPHRSTEDLERAVRQTAQTASIGPVSTTDS